MYRKSFFDDDDRNSLRQTLLQVDTKQIFRCSQYFQTYSYQSFLAPQILDKLFTCQQTSLQDRSSILKQAGGVVFVMSKLNVDHQFGLTRFNGFNLRQKIYGVNYQHPNTFRKYWRKMKYVMEDELLLRCFVCIWVMTLVTEALFDSLNKISHIMAAIVMFAGLLGIKTFVRNYMDSDINKSLNYRHSEEWCSVRREGKVVRIQQFELLVGDILVFNTDDAIYVDGIIIKVHQPIEVNEYKTIMEKFSTKKTDGWAINNQRDPFVFAGSQILSGRGEMLVCTVGPKCTFRAISESKAFIKKKTKHLRDGQGREIILSMRLAQLFIAVFIYIKIISFVIELSPLTLADIPKIMRDFLHHLSWALILQDMLRIEYMYCFIQNQACEQKEFKIINKLVLGEILKLDILLFDENVLEIQEQHNARENQLFFIMHNEQILNEVNNIVDAKILTDKSIKKCKELKLCNAYLLQQQTFTQQQLFKFKSSKFICNIDPSYYFPYLIKAYRSFNYKVGIIPTEIQDYYFTDKQVIIISTEESSEEVQNASWVKLNSATCEESLKSLFRIATSFYILKTALFNQHCLSLVTVIYGVLCINLPIWVILFLVIVEILTIYVMYRILSMYETHLIETGESFKRNSIAHLVIIIPLFVYSLYTVGNPKDIAVFLICRNIISIIYNTRMGDTILPPFREKFMDYVYFILFSILTSNLLLSYFFDDSVKPAITLFFVIASINIMYYGEKYYNDLVRKRPYYSLQTPKPQRYMK